jgi:hypothetical protein
VFAFLAGAGREGRAEGAGAKNADMASPSFAFCFPLELELDLEAAVGAAELLLRASSTVERTRLAVITFRQQTASLLIKPYVLLAASSTPAFRFCAEVPAADDAFALELDNALLFQSFPFHSSTAFAKSASGMSVSLL